MRVRKLSRFARYALVLAAVLGGVGTATVAHAAVGSDTKTANAVATLQLRDIVWT